MRKTFIIIALFFSNFVLAQDPNFHIYICFGQSNMEGQGTIETIDRTVDSRFKVMQAVNCTNPTKTKGTWYTATPPTCRCGTGISPVDNFGKTLIANLPSNITVGVIHVAVAGCKIELFDKVNYASYASGVEQWMKNIIQEYGGNPYGRIIELAKLAQKDGVIKGILIHQGESNTGDSQWPTKVKGVYNNLITDLGLQSSQVPLLAGEVVGADQGGQCASMNSIIATLPNVIPNSYVISSYGCTDQSDNLHFTSAGYRLLGQRYAEKMLTLLPASNTPVVSTITSPVNNESFEAPATVNFTASASSTAGSISKVAFYNGTTKLGEKTSSPFTYSWTNVAAGSYTITAEATDNKGNTARSEAVTVRVFAAKTPYGGTAHAIPGKIEFEHFDEGGNGNAYYDTSPESEVSPRPNFRTNEDVDIENCTDTGNGYNIGYAVAGEWLEYTVNVAETGTYNITFRVAADGAGRTISLARNGTAIANNVAIPNTGGWQTWQDVTVQNVQLTKGEQVLRLTIGNTDYVNLNYMTFTSTSVNAPTVTSPIIYCQNATATPLTATGTALKWYTAATGGTSSNTAPTPSTATVGSKSYFVSQTVSGQESPRAEIVVTTKASPAAPTVVSPITYVQGETASQLSATGTALKWYTAATGGNGSTTAPTPVTTNVGNTNYYVSQTTNDCESPRATIVVTIEEPAPIIPEEPIVIQLQAGWNLVGYPFAGEKAVEQALSSIWQYVTQVKDMDGFYSKGNNAALQSLTVLQWGKGYLVYVSQACELIFN